MYQNKCWEEAFICFSKESDLNEHSALETTVSLSSDNQHYSVQDNAGIEKSENESTLRPTPSEQQIVAKAYRKSKRQCLDEPT